MNIQRWTQTPPIVRGTPRFGLITKTTRGISPRCTCQLVDDVGSATWDWTDLLLASSRTCSDSTTTSSLYTHVRKAFGGVTSIVVSDIKSRIVGIYLRSLSLFLLRCRINTHPHTQHKQKNSFVLEDKIKASFSSLGHFPAGELLLITCYENTTTW